MAVNEKGYWVPDGITTDVVLLAHSFTNGVVTFLIKRSDDSEAYPGKFALPGGHFDKDDVSMKGCAAREVFEETGIRLNEDDLHIIDVFAGPDRDPRGYYVTTAYYAWVDISVLLRAKPGDDAVDAIICSVESLTGNDAELVAFDHAKIISALKKKLNL